MDIAGVDYSTHYVDVVRIGDRGQPVWNRFPLYGADSFDRARSVATCVYGKRSIYWDTVLAVGIEEPAGRNTGHMFRIQGAVLAQIPARMLVEKWMPSQWRKAVGLSGRASKEDVALGAVRLGAPMEWGSSDSYDAYMIALATHGVLEEGSETPPLGARAA